MEEGQRRGGRERKEAHTADAGPQVLLQLLTEPVRLTKSLCVYLHSEMLTLVLFLVQQIFFKEKKKRNKD